MKYILCILSGLFISSVCVPAAAEVKLRYGEIETPETFEPITATKMVEFRLCQLIFEGLIEPIYDEDTERVRYLPVLAETYEPAKNAALTYRFTLRKGVKWADASGKKNKGGGGRSFDADDIDFTVSLITEKQTELFDSMLKDYLKAANASGPNTVSVTFKQMFYDKEALLSFKVVPRHAQYPSYRNSDGRSVKYLKREPNQEVPPFTQHPISTGPFMYTGNSGNRYTFERNPFYGERDGKDKKIHPSIDKIEMIAYQDASTMERELQNGNIDLVVEVNPRSVTGLRGTFDLKNYTPRTIYFLAYNMQDEPADDGNSKRKVPQSERDALRSKREVLRNLDFRRAISHAIDRKYCREQYYDGTSQPHRDITGPFPIDTWAYAGEDAGALEVKPDEYNLTTADDLLTKVLKKFGYVRTYKYPGDPDHTYWQKNGEPLELTFKFVRKSQETQDVCNFIRDKLRDLGINIPDGKIQGLTEPEFHEQVYEKRDFDIVFHYYSLGETLNILPWFGSKEGNQRREPLESNLSGRVFPDVEEAIKDISREMDPDRMRARAHKAHKLIHDQQIYTFLWQLDQYAAFVRNVEVKSIHPYYFFSGIESWRIK